MYKDDTVFKKPSVYDLEQAMMNCWNVVDDLDTFYNRMDDLTEDQAMNYILGLVTIYQLKFEKMQSILENVIREGISRK